MAMKHGKGKTDAGTPAGQEWIHLVCTRRGGAMSMGWWNGGPWYAKTELTAARVKELYSDQWW